MEESSLLASESSTVKSELLRKWDAERKAKKAEEVLLPLA